LFKNELRAIHSGIFFGIEENVNFFFWPRFFLLSSFLF
jgi:hypothetical protein